MKHKKPVSKYYSIVVVPDLGGEPKDFHIRKSMLRALAIAGIVLTVLIVLGAASYWQVAKIALQNNSLQEENFKLTQSLKQMNKIKKDLTALKQFEKQIKGSLNGYVAIEHSSASDTFSTRSLQFDKIGNQEKRSIFRYVPSLLPVNGFIARGFDASSLINEPHLGLDIAAPTGTPIKCPADGVVMFSGWTLEAGNVLIIEHGFGFRTLYKHNLRNLVGLLEKVKRGQVIALLGNTGKISSGPHLHLEIWKNELPVDPVRYIVFKNKINS